MYTTHGICGRRGYINAVNIIYLSRLSVQVAYTLKYTFCNILRLLLQCILACPIPAVMDGNAHFPEVDTSATE